MFQVVFFLCLVLFRLCSDCSTSMFRYVFRLFSVCVPYIFWIFWLYSVNVPGCVLSIFQKKDRMRPLHPTSLSFWPPHLSSWEWPLLLTKVGGCRNIQIAQDFKLSSRACFAVNVRARKVQKPKEVQHCTVHQLHMGRLPDCPAGNLRILMVSLSQGLDEPGSTVLLPCISLVHTTLYFLGFHCPVFPWFAL